MFSGVKMVAAKRRKRAATNAATAAKRASLTCNERLFFEGVRCRGATRGFHR
jgi:hypothetical protein